MLRVAPSWYILTYLQLLPDTLHTTTATDKPLGPHLGTTEPTIKPGKHTNPCRRRWFSARLILVGAIFAYLLLIFLHDIFSLVYNYRDFLSDYLNNGNKIITLLILLKPITINWRNCLAFLLFAYKSSRLKRFLLDLKTFLTDVQITDRQKRHHQITFAVCFFLPLLVNICRIYMWALYLIRGDPWKLYPYGALKIPRFVVFIVDGSAQVSGELLALSVYIQIAACANAMVQGCRGVNREIRQLRDDCCRSSGEKPFKYVTLRERLVAVRARYEALVRLYTAYERLFSPQIVCGLINNGLIIFASVASFFKMGESAYWHGIHALSCAGYLFIIVVMSLFPIHLHEESLQTTELLQDVIYKYQTIQHDPTDKVISCEVKETGTEDFFLLYGFLQRTITKPLVVSAGGFVELTRSFIVSLMALIVGFTLFLLEQFEGHRPPINCRLNGTVTSLSSFYNNATAIDP